MKSANEDQLKSKSYMDYLHSFTVCNNTHFQMGIAVFIGFFHLYFVKHKWKKLDYTLYQTIAAALMCM